MVEGLICFRVDISQKVKRGFSTPLLFSPRLPPLPMCIFSHPPALGASAAYSLGEGRGDKGGWGYHISPLGDIIAT